MEGIEYLFSTPGWDGSSSHLWWSELLGTLWYIHRSSRASYTVVVAKMRENHLVLELQISYLDKHCKNCVVCLVITRGCIQNFDNHYNNLCIVGVMTSSPFSEEASS